MFGAVGQVREIVELMPIAALAVPIAHAAAALALYIASRRAPSLRPTAYATALALPLSELIGAFGRADGRALYHLSQAGQCAWLAAVVYVAGGRRSALALAAVAFGACLGWWPEPARGLYAVLQALTVALAAVHLVPRLRAAVAPTPGLLAALVVVVAEALVLVVPYAMAASLGVPVAELWGAALVVRFVEWATIFVVGCGSCWPALRSHFLARSLSRRFGAGSTLGPRRDWPWRLRGGESSGSGAERVSRG